jgi:hypothetical protein
MISAGSGRRRRSHDHWRRTTPPTLHSLPPREVARRQSRRIDSIHEPVTPAGSANNSVGCPNFFTYFRFDADAWEGASLDGARMTLSAAPEASTWAMMLIGFGGLGLAGYRASRMSGRRAAA